jgi:hypothetical protein
MLRRDCGECTLCCRLTEVPELRKPVNKWCQLCTAKGCSVYETRPQSCRSFYCFWMLSLDVPDELRPDKCGILFEEVPGENILILLVDPDRPNAWRSEEIIRYTDTKVAQGVALVVAVPDSPVKPMIVPAGRTKEQVVDGIVRYVNTVRRNNGRAELRQRPS